MANTLSAKKRVRQSKKRELRNASQKSAMRTVIKKTLKSVSGKDQTSAATVLKEASAIIDKTAGKGVIPANRASRLKSRLAKKINKLGAKSASSSAA